MLFRSRCIACGSEKHLQVHHIKPFHLHPELELEPSNLIVLCMDTNECHLKLGHGGSFKRENKNVLTDAYDFFYNVSQRQTIVERARESSLKDIIN